MALEDYICASEPRTHYNNEIWDCHSRLDPFALPKTILEKQQYQQNNTKENALERSIDRIVKTYINKILTSDLDYEKLINKPTVNEAPLVGDLSTYLDNLNIEELENILQEESING